MDTTKTITHIGLCAGYGGIELGLSRAIPNLRSVALCEIEAFACANLVAKMEAGLMDAAPIWTDLKSFPWSEFRGRVDILTGGYPCQPFSAAGKRLGKEDPRHLWPFIADGIAAMRPSVCFFENVEGHISMGLSDVIEDLAGMGYRTTWGIFSAREIGAPHQRKRVFILAYDTSIRIQGHRADWLQESRPHAGQGLPLRGGDAGCGELAHAGRIEPQGWGSATQGQQSGAGRIPRSQPAPCHDQVWPSRPGQPQHGWEPPRVVANDHRPHAGHGEQRPEREFGDLSGGCGEGRGELGDSTHQRDINAPQQDHSEAGADTDRASEGAGEGVGNSSSERPYRGSKDGNWEQPEMFGARPENMGNAASQRPQERQGQQGAGIQGTHSNGRENAERQTKPSMGGDADGPSSGVGYAELCISCDNRTDELRLLGNGVVPATAEQAFKTLLNELLT